MKFIARLESRSSGNVEADGRAVEIDDDVELSRELV